MLKFLVVVVFVCCVNARPDVGLGYNYAESNAAESNGDRDFAASDTSASGESSFGTGSLGSSNGINEAARFQQPASIRKQFFLHSAPEDGETGRPKHIVLGKSQKNYRVVFVKAPASKPTRLSVEYAPKEEKTVIYVLSQKEHELSESDIVTPAPTQPSKPEVFFVKYKTPQEAEYAQRQIQAQYDALGGSSQFSDEGIAPLRSVIGSTGSGPFGSGSNVNGAYLPPRRH